MSTRKRRFSLEFRKRRGAKSKGSKEQRDRNISALNDRFGNILPILNHVSSESIILFDNSNEGNILFANPCAKQLFQFDDDPTASSDGGAPLQFSSILSFSDASSDQSSSFFSSWDQLIQQFSENHNNPPNNSLESEPASDLQLDNLIGRRTNGTLFPASIKVIPLSNNSTQHQKSKKSKPLEFFCAYIQHNQQEHIHYSLLSESSAITSNSLSALSIPPPPPPINNDEEQPPPVTFNSVFFMDELGNILMANAKAEHEFGWTQEDFANGHNISLILGPTQAKELQDYIQDCQTEQQQMQQEESKTPTTTTQLMDVGLNFEFLARRKNGSEFHIDLGLVQVLDEDIHEKRPQIFCAFIRDLTQTKRVDDELRKRKTLLEGIIDASFDAMFTIRQDGTITMVNHAASKQFGWTKDELIGRNLQIILSAIHKDNDIKKYLESEHEFAQTNRELLARRKNGTEFTIELCLSKIKTSETDECVVCAFVRDYSNHKKDEKELKRRENLFQGVIEASFDAMFSINEEGEILMVNEAASKQFGWTKEEFIGQNVKMIVGGGHAQKHDFYLRRYLRTGEKRVMGIKRELPARRKDGSEFPIELGLREIATASGEKRMFCGFIRDLTRQKEDEERVLQKQSFFEDIINASYDALFVIDENCIIQTVNEASTEQFGWSKGEFLGQNIKMIVGVGHAKHHDDYVKRYLETGIKKVMHSQRELPARRKDGSTFFVHLGLTEVKGPGGSRMFAAFIRDLSDQKMIMQMEVEKAAAEVLILNMLPEQIASRLKDDPSHIADQHTNATILFADIVGFTAMSSQMTATDVVSMLNELFSMFDELVERYDLNKVKTIGDCYMVTSIPSEIDSIDGCSRVCYFALEMIDALHKYNANNPGRNLDLRVGVNAGPVVAGVVGTKRFLYDLWGDAVNLASRMESTGIPGKIQVTHDVTELVGPNFEFESRGAVKVKGKGEMETFLLVRRNTLFQPRTRKVRRNVRRESLHTLSLQESLSILQEGGSDNEFKSALQELHSSMIEEMLEEES